MASDIIFIFAMRFALCSLPLANHEYFVNYSVHLVRRPVRESETRSGRANENICEKLEVKGEKYKNKISKVYTFYTRAIFPTNSLNLSL